jgi:hypothetical protein
LICCCMSTYTREISGKGGKMIFPILVLTVSSFSKMFTPATTSSI